MTTSIEQQKTEKTKAERLREAIEAKKREKAAPAAKAAEEHEEAFLEAHLTALGQYDPDELVVVNVPRVGNVLLKFASRPDHAAFTKTVNKADGFDVSACLAFASRSAVFPPPEKFKALLEARNPEGFVKCAVALQTAMRGAVIEEGKE